MRYPEQEDPHSELTKRIIGCAQAVHSELRNGLNKKIYENSYVLNLPINKSIVLNKVHLLLIIEINLLGSGFPISLSTTRLLLKQKLSKVSLQTI